MKKKLQKLSLNKVELVSLNAPEMDNLRGGTSAVCVATWLSNASIAVYESIAASSTPCAYAGAFATNVAAGILGNYIYDNYINDDEDDEDDDDDYTYDGGTLPEVVITP